MLANRMFMLEFGKELVHKSLSVLGGGEHVITTPIYGALVETADGLVLLDTGISGAALNDPEALTEIYGEGMHATGPAGEPLEVALAGLGFSVTDITLAAVSHLHLDHTGGVPLLAAAGVPIVIAQAELDYGQQRAAQGTERAVAFYRRDYTAASIKWQTVTGDEQIAPGVHIVATPGHTPGHNSFRVDLPETGRWLLAADAADLGENLLERIPCGSTCETEDVPKALASVNRLMDEGDRLDARVIPGHDSVFWRAVWHPRDGHR
ncbi:metallo-beta-lactamase superfamily protein [Jatrophihabitans sp. GAS493]|uniref:N-acyl homoserine lactonase family protein n=1 Tax=Jatrophihabitans sp. GAS493 TaxID=1907575 RepID=UPI000BB9AF0E|nr:N-acyl homoserine lactonase family protein [Jatrophihabitans sp. GAS493]SOD74795.1 metallo-beta-lactamase superfamily protein [Jatrophihabitans sp. GAS493]